MQQLGLISHKRDLGKTDGERYERFMSIAKELRDLTKLDYRVLDWAFWLVLNDGTIPQNWKEFANEVARPISEENSSKLENAMPLGNLVELDYVFGLERELHRFLYC